MTTPFSSAVANERELISAVKSERAALDFHGIPVSVAYVLPKRQETATCGDREQAVRWMVSDFCYRFRQLEAIRDAGPHFANRWAKR